MSSRLGWCLALTALLLAACSEKEPSSDASAPVDASASDAAADASEVSEAAVDADGAHAEAGSDCGAANSDACAPKGCAQGCSGHGQCGAGACSCEAGYAGAACDECAPGYVRSGATCTKNPACSNDVCQAGAFECAAGSRRECGVGADNCPFWQAWTSCEGKRCSCPFAPDSAVTIQQWSSGPADEATALIAVSSSLQLVAGAESLAADTMESAQFVGEFGLKVAADAWHEKWGEGGSSAFGLARSAQGELFVAGQFSGMVNGAATRGGAATVTKFDAKHARGWTAVWDSMASEFAWSVALHPGGDLLVAGETTGQLATANAGMTDAFVGRVSSAGQIMWTKQWGSTEADTAIETGVDAAGNIYVVGSLGGDAFCRKLSATGDELWTVNWASPAYDAAWDLVPIAGGDGVFVAGLAQGPVTGSGEKGAFLSRVSASGQIVWTKYFAAPGAMFDNAKAVALTPNGEPCVAGETSGMLAPVGRGADRDTFVQCRTPMGEILWTKQIGGPGAERVYDLDVGADGVVYVVGSTAAQPYPGFPTKHSSQSFLLTIRP